MSAQLSSHKRLLTRHCNKMDSVLSSFKREKLEMLSPGVSSALGFEKESCQRLEEALAVIGTCTAKIEELWKKYAGAIDSMKEVPETERIDFDTYASRAEETLSTAWDYTVILEGRLRSFGAARREEAVYSPTNALNVTGTTEARAAALPSLTVPTFSGDIWDWDNFWVLFNTNVHAQPIPALYKFNHLLSALKGNALNAVRKFQVTEDNYGKVIQFLQEKYGNKDELVHKLILRLESISSRSPSITDQRALLEQVQVIVSQLRDKGEEINSQWLIKQVLAKFPNRVQRKVLERKYSMEGSFQMDNLLSCLDQIVSTEEKIARHIAGERSYEKESTKKDRFAKEAIQRLNFTCMYCSGNHKAILCKKYATPQERAKYLREHELCFICASPQHGTSACEKRVCFFCQGKHHSSCCFKSNYASESNASMQRMTAPNKGGKDGSSSIKHGSPVSTPTTDKGKRGASSRSRGQEPHVTHLNSQEKSMEKRNTFLPIGQLTVMDNALRKLRKIPVLMDSGAECSFIDSKLADELHLPVLGTTTLRVRTFGSREVRECTSRKVSLEIWDECGDPYTLELLTHDILTSSLKTPPVVEEDLRVLNSLNIPLTLTKDQEVAKPQVLLGCDQLWQLIRQDQTHVRLPSGLHLLPTRIGHLLTGQIKNVQHVTQVLRQGEGDKEWDECWSLQAEVNTMTKEDVEDSPDAQDERTLWERYWNLEKEGVEEFTSSEKEARSLEDEAVLKYFRDTVEKKDDGYYVRLPWKEISSPLPDNRAIAWRRLISVWNSLQKDKELLEKYNSIFREQERLRIIEEVVDERIPVEGKVHYLPHQAVLTPQKTTTKVRVVFDASAHFKDSPSLNDALYRGPVILPKLYGLLLRFRIGRVALISDVEKAFLQVRLQEIDRDATRCLWLKDHRSPPSGNNLQVFRFTRVTFGLLPSPFLLAATTHYHLDQYPDEVDLVTQIKNNLYVDNLVLTTNTTEEASRVYSRTKDIFNELQMNLREFATNDNRVLDWIPQSDRSKEANPKVLGIRWNLSEDRLGISCDMIEAGKMTKRTVASMVASVYDPMGWILPLLHKAKVFLQSLWKENLEWDTPLPEHKKVEWGTILENVKGFQMSIPRFVAAKEAVVRLFTCADASADAFAACAYIYSGGAAHLIMAKGKLPTLKSKTTIPKMELNALTLAMRLTASVAEQIASTISISTILVFSDSEIVLNWVSTDLRHDIGTFIKNRVMEIHKILQHLTNRGYRVQLGHIPSHLNPADCATRGLDKTQLGNHYWWTGPAFLGRPEEEWVEVYRPVVIKSNVETTENAEGKTAPVNKGFSQTMVDNIDIFRNIKSPKFYTIQRVVVYMLRFICNALRKTERRQKTSVSISPLLKKFATGKENVPNGEEMEIAVEVLVRQHQRSHLNPMILKSLKHLGIFQDQWGILRCRGRLGKSALTEPMKFPMLILQKTWLSQTIIRNCHESFHVSTSHTMAKVRENYWIPKLRAEVTKIIRRCTACQKFNNLPYKYPEQEHLPARRVTRSRPFAHIGLDYFGPLQVKNEEHIGKCYGAIITCLVTRLIHLDIVSDNSTLAFLQMLRRFFARRGLPLTITSDNAPTFALGDVILSESLQRMKDDPMVATEISKRHISWMYITPYAPWQGGVYERLIHSVKLAMHKVLGKATPTREELGTIITEIEAMLNTRPLLYAETDAITDRVLRPIDFLQNEFEVPLPTEGESEDQEDPQFLTPAERVTLQTKKQVIKALESSYKLTEKYWQVWHSQYLTSLREKHQVEVKQKRGSRIAPKKGQIVLISDMLQPRYSWKLGRIDELVANKEGTVREAVVALPSRRKIRRPVNLLIPLEIDDEDIASEDEHDTPTSSGSSEQPTATREENQDTSRQNERYNLRPRGKFRSSNLLKPNMNSTGVLMTIICALMIGTSGITGSQRDTHGMRIRCIQGGVELTAAEQKPYEICAEDYCIHIDSPHEVENIIFPARIILHEHEVQWKFLENATLKTVETVCPKAPFCDYIDCTLCSSLLFNPECWPVGAILVAALLLYLLIMGCYVLLYVPVVIGKPMRGIMRGVCRVIQCAGHSIYNTLRSTPRRRARDLVELLAIVLTLTLITSTADGCQQLDVFSHHGTICNNVKGKRVCKIQMSEILKINPFKREACLRLSKNSTTVYEVRVLWKSLNLACRQETDYCTRNTEYQVVSSKRCAHKGSCTGGKCADVKGSTLLKELASGNVYPGTTYCVASCGGLGCDCFWPGSACLFYRVYAVPTSDRIYEIFHCLQWKETAKMEITAFDYYSRERRRWVVEVQPNIPITRNVFTFTLSSITAPPTPLLSASFLTDGNRTALWDPRFVPALLCETPEAARYLSCEIKEDCACYPAETQATCKCKEINMEAWITNLQHQLPVTTPSLSFRRDTEAGVRATITTGTTSEIILTVQDEMATDLIISDAICTVADTVLTGCYKCAKGAEANITCKSSQPAQAEISCEGSNFAVRCDERGVSTLIRFTFTRARVGMTCAVSCGSITSTFRLEGILKFTHSAHSMITAWLNGDEGSPNEIQWPDIYHIADVFVEWYKTVAVASALVLLMVILTYIFITTCGGKLLIFMFRLLLRFFRAVFRMCCKLPIYRTKHAKVLHGKSL